MSPRCLLKLCLIALASACAHRAGPQVRFASEPALASMGDLGACDAASAPKRIDPHVRGDPDRRARQLQTVGSERPLRVHRQRRRAKAFRAKLDCTHTPCTEMGALDSCGSGVVRCQDHLCTYEAKH